MASTLTNVFSDQFLPGYLYVTYKSVILNLSYMHEPYDISRKNTFGVIKRHGQVK